MALDLTGLQVGDFVRFKNGQVAKVVDIGDNFRLFFDKEVAAGIDDLELCYGSEWYYEQNGDCSGCTNHIVEIERRKKCGKQ